MRRIPYTPLHTLFLCMESGSTKVSLVKIAQAVIITDRNIWSTCECTGRAPKQWKPLPSCSKCSGNLPEFRRSHWNHRYYNLNRIPPMWKGPKTISLPKRALGCIIKNPLGIGLEYSPLSRSGRPAGNKQPRPRGQILPYGRARWCQKMTL